MSEILVQCDVCNRQFPKDKVVIDKGVNYPEIARDKHEDDDVYLCYECNKKLVDRDVPNVNDSS